MDGSLIDLQRALIPEKYLFNDVPGDYRVVSFLGVACKKTKSIKILMFNFPVWKLVLQLFL